MREESKQRAAIGTNVSLVPRCLKAQDPFTGPGLGKAQQTMVRFPHHDFVCQFDILRPAALSLGVGAICWARPGQGAADHGGARIDLEARIDCRQTESLSMPTRFSGMLHAHSSLASSWAGTY